MYKGKGMVNNPIFRGSSIYEEIPKSLEAVYQNSGVQNATKAHPPSLPGPRKGEPHIVTCYETEELLSLSYCSTGD